MEPPEMADGVTPVEDLARHIYETMEALDPMEVDWEDLSVEEHRYCLALTRRILDRSDLVVAALACRAEKRCLAANDGDAATDFRGIHRGR